MSLDFGKYSCIRAARLLVYVSTFQMSNAPMMETYVLTQGSSSHPSQLVRIQVILSLSFTSFLIGG
jgi:hypothetical protein